MRSHEGYDEISVACLLAFSCSKISCCCCTAASWALLALWLSAHGAQGDAFAVSS